MVRLTIDLPEEWAGALRLAAGKAGYKSVNAYVRFLIEQSGAGEEAKKPLPPISRAWGRSKVTDDTDVQYDTEVTDDTELTPEPPPEKPKSSPSDFPKQKSGMAQPKGDVKVPDGYVRRSVAPPSNIPSVVGGRGNNRREDVD